MALEARMEIYYVKQCRAFRFRVAVLCYLCKGKQKSLSPKPKRKEDITMNVRIKKLIFTAALAVFMLLACLAVPAAAEPDVHPDTDEPVPAYERSSQACDILERALIVSPRGAYPTVWVDYYGGGWFADDDVFHVFLTDMSRKDELVSLLGEYADAVEFMQGEHSLNEMNELVQSVVNELSANGIKPFSCGVDTKKHGVVVTVRNDDYEKVKALLDERDIDWLFIDPSLGSLSFISGESSLSEGSQSANGGILNKMLSGIKGLVNRIVSILSIQLKGGFPISTYQGSVTLGICGKYQGYNAIASCGHAMPLNTTVLYNGSTIGTVKHCSFANGAYGDFSITKIANANFTPTFYVASTPIYQGRTSNLNNGQIIYTKGAVNTATLLSVSYNEVVQDDNNITICGLNKAVVTSGSVYFGDSGGSCYYNNTFYGVISAGDNAGNIYYTPFSYFNNAGFSIYPHTHIYSYTDLNNTYHKCTCTLCGYYFTQQHSATWDFDHNCCAMCGHHG